MNAIKLCEHHEENYEHENEDHDLDYGCNFEPFQTGPDLEIHDKDWTENKGVSK